MTLRTLTIDPTSRGFAYAVLEGSDVLIDWGLAHARIQKERRALARIKKYIDKFEPELIVLEDGRGSRRVQRVRSLLAEVENIAKKRRIEVRKISRGKVRKAFTNPRMTKQEIAETVARFFPELEPRLPRRRKPWMSEDERMSIFDAVSFALSILWAIESRRTS